MTAICSVVPPVVLLVAGLVLTAGALPPGVAALSSLWLPHPVSATAIAASRAAIAEAFVLSIRIICISVFLLRVFVARFHQFRGLD